MKRVLEAIASDLRRKAWWSYQDTSLRGLVRAAVTDGTAAYTEAWTAGRRLRREEAAAEIERVLAAAEGSRQPEPADRDGVHLTPREREVLRLLIDGRSNREIAEALFIGHRTATTHVTNILAKLGVETRAAAVTYAFQHDLA